MRVLFDVNVLLDVLLDREPHVQVATKLVALVDNGRIGGAICATAVTTLYYLGAKDLGRRRAHDHIRTLLSLFEVAPVDQTCFSAPSTTTASATSRTQSPYEAAHAAGVGAIVTRNGRDFAKATIPVFDPHELLAAVATVTD